MNLADRFPPLYECSVCGKPVKVTPQGEGLEPVKVFACEHTTATIWANRKVTLRGKGAEYCFPDALTLLIMLSFDVNPAITWHSK